MSAGRSRFARLAMAAGVALMVAGAGIRVGAVPLSLGGGTGGALPSGPPTGAVPVATPLSTVGASPPAGSAQSLSPSPATPAPTGVATPGIGALWFADDFDAVAAWPVGLLDWLTTAVVEGTYRIAALPTDLPVVVLAAAGDAAPGVPLTATLALALDPAADPATAAGLAVEGADGARLLALVGVDGHVSLLRDSIESLDLLASGSIVAPSYPLELALSLGVGTASVSVDGIQVTSARADLVPTAVGLAVWAVDRSASITIDSYRVWVSADAARP